MLKCKIDKKKNLINVKGSGTTQELMVETSVMIQQIYTSIYKNNPEAAKGYRSHLLIMLLKTESPVWKTYEDEED